MNTKKALWDESKVRKSANGPLMNVNTFIGEITSDRQSYDTPKAELGNLRVLSSTTRNAKKRVIRSDRQIPVQKADVSDVITNIKNSGGQ